jgi:RNA recognition motif-containing protein
MNRLSLVSRPAASRLFACGQANKIAVRRFSEDINPLRLFVGGLSWKSDEDRVREAFQSFGEISHGASHHRQFSSVQMNFEFPI